MKKLKTGDVKRIPRTMGINDDDRWVCMGWSIFPPLGMTTRERARALSQKAWGERIARILSIGPKYVTVRISK